MPYHLPFFFSKKKYFKGLKNIYNGDIISYRILWNEEESLKMFLKPFSCNWKEANGKQFHPKHRIVVQS